MPVLLYRVDERLIHGQVIIGWAARLRAERIIVVDDALAGSDWEQELYTVGVPAGMSADFVDVATAIDRLPEWQTGAQRILLLTRDIATMVGIGRNGLLRGAEVNIGGVHHAPGRDQVLRYVFLSEAERRDLRTLADQGAEVSARDIPGARRVGLDDLTRSA